MRRKETLAKEHNEVLAACAPFWMQLLRGQSYKSIGRSYGLQGSYVGRIVRREIWAYTE